MKVALSFEKVFQKKGALLWFFMLRSALKDMFVVMTATSRIN
jgi:hypothetical protein